MLYSHLLISARNDDDLYYNKKEIDDTNLQSHEFGFQTMMLINKKPTFIVVLFSFQMLDAILFHTRSLIYVLN